jgi:hypothetical protein
MSGPAMAQPEQVYIQLPYKDHIIEVVNKMLSLDRIHQRQYPKPYVGGLFYGQCNKNLVRCELPCQCLPDQGTMTSPVKPCEIKGGQLTMTMMLAIPMMLKLEDNYSE